LVELFKLLLLCDYYGGKALTAPDPSFMAFAECWSDYSICFYCF